MNPERHHPGDGAVLLSDSAGMRKHARRLFGAIGRRVQAEVGMRCVVCRQADVRPGEATVTLERERLTLVYKRVPARMPASLYAGTAAVPPRPMSFAVAESGLSRTAKGNGVRPNDLSRAAIYFKKFERELRCSLSPSERKV